MNRARSLLANAADRFDLPVDVLAGIPKIEMTGFHEIRIETHKGLLEYEKEQIGIETIIGKIVIGGKNLTIVLMNRYRIAIKGDITSVQIGDAFCE